jgi:hypothetical protein
VVLKLRSWGYCTSVSHTDSEWVMISPNGSNSGQNGWVQVGYQSTAGFLSVLLASQRWPGWLL